MSARCYEDYCGNHSIDETESRVKFFLAAMLMVAAVYGAVDLGNSLLDIFGR